MDEVHKKNLIKYSIIFSIFLAFALVGFGLSLLTKYLNKTSFEKAIQSFFKNAKSISADYKNINITSLEHIGNAISSSSTKRLNSLSVEAFLLKHKNGEFLIFVQPLFTNAGLANGIFVCKDINSKVEYLGLLSSSTDKLKVSDTTILRLSTKLEKLLEEAK